LPNQGIRTMNLAPSNLSNPPATFEPLERRLLMARPDPDPAENVYFRLPLSSDTTTHFYYDRNEGAAGAVAWNGTGQSYDGHRGTDYSGGPRGRAVFASAPGILIAKDDGWGDMQGPGNGNYVRINHGNNRAGLPINSVYLHFNAGSVTTKALNSFIAAAEQVGGIGTSGNSTGLHLHLETQVNRVAFDPYKATGSSEISWWVNQGSGAPSTLAQASKFSIGDTAEAYELAGDTLNVRSPNPTSSSIGTRSNGQRGTVLEGPVWAAFNNDFNNSLWVFYRIAWEGGLTGWSVQNWLRKAPDTTPPQVQQSDFLYQTAPQKLSFRFSENVAASLLPGDLTVRNTATQATAVINSVSYDSATNTAGFALLTTLPSGSYTATLDGAGVADASGNLLGANHTFNFSFLVGDADGNGSVNSDDFNILATNFGTTGRTFSAGNFDYDAGGLVNSDDFNMLATNFGISLSSGFFGGTRIRGGPGRLMESLRADLLA
jgi:hypothetical protein